MKLVDARILLISNDRTGKGTSVKSIGSWVVALTLGVVLGGCAQSRSVTAPVRTSLETVAFTSEADRVNLIDAATSILVSNNFSITLANERIGLLQTDYVPLTAIHSMHPDSIGFSPILDDMLVRITLNAEDRGEVKYVQLKGSFQRPSGKASSSDGLVGLYWLEQVANDIARSVGVEFLRQVSQTAYADALKGIDSQTASSKRSGGIGGAMKAIGVVVAVLFAATLAVGAFGPGEARPTAQ